jgi:hypothetical protein
VLKTEVVRGPDGRVILMDSITKVTEEDEGAIIVSASHGGVSSGEFALAIPLRAVIFNDAGIGKDSAGIAALEMLEARGVAAGTVAHTSARIGDSDDMWKTGVISHVNARGRAMGLSEGAALNDALRRVVQGPAR